MRCVFNYIRYCLDTMFLPLPSLPISRLWDAFASNHKIRLLHLGPNLMTTKIGQLERTRTRLTNVYAQPAPTLLIKGEIIALLPAPKKHLTRLLAVFAVPGLLE